MFTTIAEAEAKIHGTSVEAIHFHEVGATDSIVDIAGAAIGIDYLDVDAAYCSPVEVGSGMVRCEHGLCPVPAPATAEILTDAPCRHGGVEGEATTPTGAAILKCRRRPVRAAPGVHRPHGRLRYRAEGFRGAECAAPFHRRVRRGGRRSRRRDRDQSRSRVQHRRHDPGGIRSVDGQPVRERRQGRVHDADP